MNLFHINGTFLDNQKPPPPPHPAPKAVCLLWRLLSFVTAYNISPVRQRLTGESLSISAWVKLQMQNRLRGTVASRPRGIQSRSSEHRASTTADKK